MTEKTIDTSRRTFLAMTVSVTGVTGAVLTGIPFVKTMLPSARAKVGGAAVTVDLRKIETGSQAVVKWRGKPVWVLRRTPKMLADLEKLEPWLRDPFF